jgi:hypothetical protein
MVARPRNHLDLQGLVLQRVPARAGRFRHSQYAGQIPVQLDLEVVTHRHQPNAIDQPADQLERLLTRAGCSQRVFETRNPIAVDRRQGRRSVLLGDAALAPREAASALIFSRQKSHDRGTKSPPDLVPHFERDERVEVHRPSRPTPGKGTCRRGDDRRKRCRRGWPRSCRTGCRAP